MPKDPEKEHNLLSLYKHLSARFVLLVGPNGSGKSRALASIARAHVNGEFDDFLMGESRALGIAMTPYDRFGIRSRRMTRLSFRAGGSQPENTFKKALSKSSLEYGTDLSTIALVLKECGYPPHIGVRPKGLRDNWTRFDEGYPAHFEGLTNTEQEQLGSALGILFRPELRPDRRGVYWFDLAEFGSSRLNAAQVALLLKHESVLGRDPGLPPVRGMIAPLLA